MKQSNSRVLLGGVILAGAVGLGGFAFTASNTVPNTKAGDGQGTVSGYVASAIHYNASEFHTFDGKRTGKNNGGLLTLNGNVAGHRLKICSPRAIQLRIEDAAQDEADAEDS